MTVSIEQYRQRIGCFARVATILSSCGVRSNNNSKTCRKQSKHSRTDLRLVIRLGCFLVVAVSVIQSSALVLDLTRFGDVEKNPGPNSGMDEQQIQKVLSNCLQPSLYIDFLGECIPLDFYTRFQLDFIKWAKVNDEDDNSDSEQDDEDEDDSAPRELPCNLSRFAKKENGVEYSVIVVRHITRIQVAILAEEWGNIAKSVLSFVRDTMKEIRSTYPNCSGMRSKVGLKCDLCTEEKELCARHQNQGCTNDDCVCILSLGHLLKKSPSCNRNILNKRSFSQLNQSPWAQAQAQLKSCRKHPKTTVDTELNVETGSEKRSRVDPGSFSFTKTSELGSCPVIETTPEEYAETQMRPQKRSCIELGASSVPKAFGQSTSQLDKESSVSDLHLLVRQNICRELDLKHSVGGDYRQLAGHFGMSNKDIQTISQNPNPTDNVLEWVGRNRKNTIDKLREVLVTMRRDDCVDIIDQSLQSGDIENLSGQSTADNKDDITALKEILFAEYKKRATRLQPLPWLDTPLFELDKIYTKLGIIQRENTRWKLTDKTVELSDIFDRKLNPQTILIEGSPGMGKTTLSLKLAYDWAMGKMPGKFPPIQLVFLIKCRDMKSDIFEAIRDQLLPLDKDGLKKELHQIIQKHQDKILLVVDGLDETPERAEEHVMKLLKRNNLQKCYVVATSRQGKGLKVRKYFDTLLEIKGYSEDDISYYIHKYFADELDLAHGLLKNLHVDSRLKTLATNPLNTVLLCVVFEDCEGQLPSTVTELYEKIVLCITKRYRARHNLGSVEDKLFETYQETLGKLAYKGLHENSLSFLESDLNVDGIQYTEMGFLYKEVSRRKIEPDHTYWFLHKTFQEYLVAFYFTNTFETVDDMVEKLKDTAKFMQVLMFVSGMLRKKDAVQCRNFVQKLGTVLLQSMHDKNEIVGILCAVLSESFVDKDMARIIYQFLPKNVLAPRTPYREYVAKTLPGILNLLCTKDGVYQKVHFKQLNLCGNKVSTSDVGLICKALKAKLKVRKLELNHCKINNEAVPALADMLFHNTTVEHINITNNSLNAEAAKILAKGLRQNTTLSELYVAMNNLEDAGVKAIAAALKHDTSFKNMAARNNNDGDKEDDKTGSTLHTLHIQNTECGEDGASAVADMLRTNNTLTELGMAINPLGSKGVTHVAEALKLNKTLEIIFLDNTDCSNEGAVAMAGMLRNETLTTLYLSNCSGEPRHENKIGKDGAVALADALKVNKSLKELHLSNNDITDEGVECLIEALVVNTTLDELCIKYPGDGARELENDEPLKKKCRAEGRITWNCDSCLELRGVTPPQSSRNSDW